MSRHAWAVIQRRLAFEEPTTKWLHLRRLVKRASRQSDRQAEDPAQLANYRQTERPRDALSDQLKSNAGRILNVLLALQEVERFSAPALDSWQIAAQIETDRLDRASFPVVAQGAARAWIKFAWDYHLPWHLLTEIGPWSHDPRTAFILEAYEHVLAVARRSPESIPWSELSASFRTSIQHHRATLPGSVLPNVIVLVEGATEAVLLPPLSTALGLDFNSLGAMVVAAGGANQVVRKYSQLKEAVTLPVFCLLDRDAKEQGQMLAELLRPNDHLHILQDGEIEDVFALEILVELLNNYVETLSVSGGTCLPISSRDFVGNGSRTAVLEKLWRRRDLGKFDKVGFAKFAAGHIDAHSSISPDGRQLIGALAQYSLQATTK
jgi:hypothetical protein